MKKLKNLNCDKTWELKLWQNSTKLDCDETQKSKCDKTQKPKIVFTNNVKSNEEFRALLKTKDEFGISLYDTTDSEQSSDEEEWHFVVRGGRLGPLLTGAPWLVEGRGTAQMFGRT